MSTYAGWFDFCAGDRLQQFWYKTQLGCLGNYYTGSFMTEGEYLNVSTRTTISTVRECKVNRVAACTLPISAISSIPLVTRANGPIAISFSQSYCD